MTIKKILNGVGALTLAIALNGAAFSLEFAGCLTKDGETYRVAVDLLDVAKGKFSMSKLSLSSQFGRGEDDAVSVFVEFSALDYLNITADTKFSFSTRKMEFYFVASANGNRLCFPLVRCDDRRR